MTAEPQARPQAVWKGNVAIYEAPDGSAVVAYRGEGGEADSHHVIPARVWTVMGAALRGEEIDISPMQLLKMLMPR